MNSDLTLWAGKLDDEVDDMDVASGGGVVKWGGTAIISHTQITRVILQCQGVALQSPLWGKKNMN